MHRQIVSTLALVAVISGISNPAQAGLINGDFESPQLNVLSDGFYKDFAAGSNGLTGWTVEAGSVGILKDWAGLPAVNGTQFLDLDGYNPGTMSQVMQATAGQAYQLNFDFAGYFDGDSVGNSLGNNLIYQLFDDTTKAILKEGSVLIQTQNLLTWSSVDLQATATSDRLGVRFRSDGAGNDGYIGPVIDNVTLSPISPAATVVPEPSSFFLTAIAGILGLGYRLRNR